MRSEVDSLLLARRQPKSFDRIEIEALVLGLNEVRHGRS